MIISTSSHNIQLSNGVDECVQRSLRSALKRVSHDIISIDVFMQDINGPKGGIDKTVKIRIDLRNRQHVVIETSDENLYAAIRKGSKRAKLAVNRRLGRTNQVIRHKLRERLRDVISPVATQT